MTINEMKIRLKELSKEYQKRPYQYVKIDLLIEMAKIYDELKKNEERMKKIRTLI